jgi:hypothetical protein
MQGFEQGSSHACRCPVIRPPLVMRPLPRDFLRPCSRPECCQAPIQNRPVQASRAAGPRRHPRAPITPMHHSQPVTGLKHGTSAGLCAAARPVTPLAARIPQPGPPAHSGAALGRPHPAAASTDPPDDPGSGAGRPLSGRNGGSNGALQTAHDPRLTAAPERPAPPVIASDERRAALVAHRIFKIFAR